MANFNRVVLMGNLTRDPEFKMAGDLAICKLGMAVNRKTKDREDVTFVDLTAFGRQAELINQYLTKGSPLFIEGRLSWSSWDAADGSKRSKLEVIIENFQFMGGRPDGEAPAEEVVEAPKKVAKKAAKKVTKKATRKVTKKPAAKKAVAEAPPF